MIDVREALRLIDEAVDRVLAGQAFASKTSSCALEHATGRVLREDLFADRPHPPFDRVAMDGIAIVWSEFEAGQRDFEVDGCQRAGIEKLKLENIHHCFEVMTGSILPEGCDTVVPYESIEITNDQIGKIARIKTDVQYRQNIHFQGSDYAAGEVLLKKGRSIGSAEVAVAATIGKNALKAASLPKIAIVSTGDELVDVEETPLAHQIRKSNVHALSSLLGEFSLNSFRKNVQLFHLPDKKEDIFQSLQKLLDENDVLLLSGGVSAGKFDFVPEVLADLKVEKIFHKVAQKPGKPMWFGLGPKKQLVYGLPGNPISAVVCARRYVVPGLQRLIGLKRSPNLKVRLSESVNFKKNLTYFCPVRVEISEEAVWQAFPVSFNGSGDLAALTKSDGFIQLPVAQDQFSVGEVHPFFSWRSF